MEKYRIDFSKKIRDWDGFGVNYVETAQTQNYNDDPQEYGGFSLLSESARQEILDMIFGENGLKPGLVKMFLDPFHQEETKLNAPNPSSIDLSNYDHTATTRWMRYFAQEGLKRTRTRGGDITFITGLYSPPAWMTVQRFLRGRDLDPKYYYECGKYMVSWAKYLREVEGLPIKYISLHNEGEAAYRWPEDGSDAGWEGGRDYNMYWPPEQVVEFIKIMRELLDKQGMQDVGVTPGETSTWVRFYDWGYADAIADDQEAVEKLGLITSHGFSHYVYNKWFADHRSAGNDVIREKRPDLHSWVTSSSWGKMDVFFVKSIRDSIYAAKVNGFIPWACIQRPVQWKGGDPNPGTAFKVDEEGNYYTQSGYYYYKQVCRAGQPGMSVARVTTTDLEIDLMAFGSNGTNNPDAFTVINISDESKRMNIRVIGTKSEAFTGYRTGESENYKAIGEYVVSNGKLEYVAPPKTVTTFFGKFDV